MNPVPVAPNAPASDNGALSSAPDSPAHDSPVTPFPPTPPAAPVKIDIDYTGEESDVRHEPLELIDDASAKIQAPTPIDSVPIPIAPQKEPFTTELHDVQMSEPSVDESQDVPMSESPPESSYPNGQTPTVEGLNIQSPRARSPTPAASRPSSPREDPVPSTSRLPEVNGGSSHESDQPPPAKRARRLSDGEGASLAHSVTPPPTTAVNSVTTNGRSATPAPAPEPGRRSSTLSPGQFKFCLSTVRSLKRLKDAAPFLFPVDPVALNIPHYPSVIKHPMDFSTIDKKLNSSNVAKPDPDLANPRYYHADEFIADVRLVFANCVTFNGPDHAVSQMGKRLETVFEKQIKQMPAPAEEPKPPVVKKPSTPPPPPPPPAPKKVPARRPSTSVPTIRRSETETARPKREIHPPPSKDLPYADLPKKPRRSGKSKHDDGTADQLKFCLRILNDVQKKQYYNFAHVFYEPVDWRKLDIPSYPKIIKKPMDMATMRKKLEQKEYPNATKFHDDFRLMLQNCATFNPPGTVVHNYGVQMQRLFDEKWAALPPLREVNSDDDDEEEEESEDDESRAIAMMESQIETMKGSIAALKNKKVKKEKKDKKRDKASSPTTSSKPNGKQSKNSAGKKKSKKPIADNDVLSFEQKKDLSEAIQYLDGPKLEKVISIIHEGVPEIRDSTEEIELDIDSLPAMVLTKLYNLVLRPLRPPPVKRHRTGTGTGTGGLKRKSMDEDIEAEKIRQLEERMRLFDGDKGAGGAVERREGSVHSSEESSSDSSGSDSE